jgi:hypothetical protein
MGPLQEMGPTMSSNESIHSQGEVRIGSDRNFGIVFAVVFILVATLPLVHGGTARWWALAAAAVFGVAALFAPTVLRPLNLVWFKLGIVLHHVVNPFIICLLFFCSVIHIVLVMWYVV